MRIILAAILGAVLFAGAAPAQTPPKPMTLFSPAFADGGIIPDKYTQNSPSPVSPPLVWENVPAGTQSFTLILHDPDVALRKTTADVLHWLAFDIPASARGLPEGVPNQPRLADGTIQPDNLGGHPGFMGPGSRIAYHHYTFELFALDTKLDLGPEATRDQVLSAMNGHILAKAVTVGRFHR